MYLFFPAKMLVRSTVFASLLLFMLAAAASPVNLRTEHLTNPIGIDAPRPQFAWQSDATTPNWMQSAYQLLVATSEKNLVQGKADVWDTGRVGSSDSINIVYGGPALKSQTRYFWLVRVWDNNDNVSTAIPAWFETGLLSPSDWRAQWVRRIDSADERERAAVQWLWLSNTDARAVAPGSTVEFRYPLHLDARPIRASLHILVAGSYVATVNGTLTGQHKDFGAFDWEEIGQLLKPGDNEILVKVTSPVARPPTANGPAGFAASIRITAPSATERRIPSDTTWLARTGNGDWQPAQQIGSLSTPLVFANDRHTIVVGPNRIASEGSLFRKDFKLSSNIQSARLTITALGSYRAFLNRQARGAAESSRPRLHRLQQTCSLSDL